MDVDFQTSNRALLGFPETCRHLGPRALHRYAPQQVVAPKHVTHGRTVDARQQMPIERLLKRRSYRSKPEENGQPTRLCGNLGPQAQAARWREARFAQSHYLRAEGERPDININLTGDEAAHV